MIKAVLLDLDNTLLLGQGQPFTAEYLRLAADYLAKDWRHPDLSGLLAEAAQALVGPRDMQQTNAQLVSSILCRELGLSPERIQAALADFHRQACPLLQRLTQPAPGAAALVEALAAQKYAVAIITDSVYPADAVQRRLRWAGLPDDVGCYALVAQASNMHFARSDPAFYTEAAARIGIEPDEAVMVGGSLEDNILPAQRVGLHTYHIRPAADNAPASPADASGTLADFDAAARQNWFDTLIPRPLTPEVIEPEMRGNLGALFGTLADIKPHHWKQHPDPNEWSPIQVICHLLDSEQRVQRPRLERIQHEDNPFLVDPPPPPGPREAPICDDDGLNAARQFTAERLETLNWLRQRRPEDWLRPARHSIFSLTTLLEMAHFTAQHDRLHINQLCQTLGRCT